MLERVSATPTGAATGSLRQLRLSDGRMHSVSLNFALCLATFATRRSMEDGASGGPAGWLNAGWLKAGWLKAGRLKAGRLNAGAWSASSSVLDVVFVRDVGAGLELAALGVDRVEGALGGGRAGAGADAPLGGGEEERERQEGSERSRLVHLTTECASLSPFVKAS